MSRALTHVASSQREASACGIVVPVSHLPYWNPCIDVAEAGHQRSYWAAWVVWSGAVGSSQCIAPHREQQLIVHAPTTRVAAPLAQLLPAPV